MTTKSVSLSPEMLLDAIQRADDLSPSVANFSHYIQLLISKDLTDNTLGEQLQKPPFIRRDKSVASGNPAGGKSGKPPSERVISGVRHTAHALAKTIRKNPKASN